MRQAIIGITSYGPLEDDHFFSPAHYVNAIRRANGLPILIPPGYDEAIDYFNLIDGLLLTGGGDINPTYYNGVHHETIYNVDPDRDTSEIALAKLAIKHQKPTFGICRGAQLINVIEGGSLHEHIPDVVGEAIHHRLPPREPTPHKIIVHPNTSLATIVQQTDFEAQSWHHQSINKLASSLIANAQAPDGIVEGVEMPTHRWLVCVQWHPELDAETNPLQQRLFDAFVLAAANAHCST